MQKLIQKTVVPGTREYEEIKTLYNAAFHEIDDLDDDNRNEQLAIYWCAKEAVFKLLSRYNVDFAEQIEIERFRLRGEGELEATFTSKDEEEEFDLEYMTFDRHVLVWVVGE